ncbi:heme-degrading domain-containing protein [Edaphobacter sp. 12200R-103]|jgi:uncharacterized protein (UPF0303 family)|uniref:heme-degrading domain-containing protein n=1 Tax=Edaphobacter sp. 12200R-103 TaxID=2703788 RepID=UPI00138C0F47|nr:heme-degrading domain-containing protein [Edaphobacter sp. 12200R-103]QHS52578.1 heme-degrading domain-containing protein [Edaphobacter sp. 12200R-103]
MASSADLARVIHQETELRLPQFNHEDAWNLGVLLRDLAIARRHTLVIDIRRFGQPIQPLFYAALEGTTPDNARWVQRKANVVGRFHRSSYQVGLYLAQSNVSFREKYALEDADYAAHGGSFPLHVVNTGVIGAVTVSGLPQREDHNLVVEALCRFLGRDPAELRLP